MTIQRSDSVPFQNVPHINGVVIVAGKQQATWGHVGARDRSYKTGSGDFREKKKKREVEKDNKLTDTVNV